VSEWSKVLDGACDGSVWWRNFVVMDLWFIFIFICYKVASLGLCLWDMRFNCKQRLY